MRRNCRRNPSGGDFGPPLTFLLVWVGGLFVFCQLTKFIFVQYLPLGTIGSGEPVPRGALWTVKRTPFILNGWN